MKVNIFGILFIFMLLLSLCHLAYGTTYTFLPRIDSYVDEANTSLNYGTNTNLRIKGTTNSNVLLQFSQSEILTAIGTQHVVSATLKLYVESNFNGWGSGTYMDAHQVSLDWDETSVTWSCANSACEDSWQGGYYENYISDSVFQQNSQTGWSSFNVTSDVQLIQNGYTHYGWLIRKRDYSNMGSLDYTSVQGTSVLKPQLVVVVDAQSCSPSTIDSVSPGLIPSDGTTQTITVLGTNLNTIQLAKVDNSTISYTLVNNSTITFNLSYSSVGNHEIWFRSNCLSEPLNNYIIVSNTAAYLENLNAMYPDVITCGSMADVTLFSADGSKKFLCFNGSTVRLIGYSEFEEITWNNHYCTSNCSDYAQIPNYMQSARYTPGDSLIPSHGVNLQRIFAIGAAGNLTNEETMPFKKTCGGKYCVSGTPSLNGTGKTRLRSVLSNAMQNGQAVELTLFDSVYFSPNQGYSVNPWNPNNNDMYSTCTTQDGGLDTSDPFPEWYYTCKSGNNNTDACPDDQLNCLGLIQKNFVNRIITEVQFGNNNGSFKNVFLEVMNEAASKDNSGNAIDVKRIAKWHNTVAKWVRSKHQYFVSANVAPDNQTDLTACCSSCNADSCSCDTASCTNQLQVFLLQRINIVTLHGGGKDTDTCTRAKSGSWRFKKPVIIDDDGYPAGRNTNCTVRTWALNVKGCFGRGRAHFNHLDEAKHMPNSTAVCNVMDETGKKLDCNALNQLADSEPSDLCNQGLTCTPSCPMVYCFKVPSCSGNGKCDNNVQTCQ